MRMMCACGRCAHADDVCVMPGVVLHEIGQLRQEEAILNTALHKADWLTCFRVEEFVKLDKFDEKLPVHGWVESIPTYDYY